MKKTLQQSAFFPYQVQPTETFILEDAPVEKLNNKGAGALTNAEVLAAIIGANSATSLILAKQIMAKYNNNFSSLATASIHELTNIQGVTRIIAARVTCAFEMGRRKECECIDKVIFKTSGDIAQFFKAMIADEPIEYFYAAYVSRSLKLIKVEQISKGGLTGTVADPRIILKLALELNATGIVLCHNHPSGNLKPSRADEELTMKIRNAAKFMDINVMDHIIVSTEGYYSFADEGLM